MALKVAGSSPVTHPSHKLHAEHRLDVPADGRQCGQKAPDSAEVFRKGKSRNGPTTSPFDDGLTLFKAKAWLTNLKRRNGESAASSWIARAALPTKTGRAYSADVHALPELQNHAIVLLVYEESRRASS